MLYRDGKYRACAVRVTRLKRNHADLSQNTLHHDKSMANICSNDPVSPKEHSPGLTVTYDKGTE